MSCSTHGSCCAPDFELISPARKGWGSEKTLARIRAEATYLGYVPEADLPGLVAGATAFVYPSLYEGFGFPVVQAMAAGVPVVTSNTSCLPEIAGDAAVLVDPRSPSEIAGGLDRLLGSESTRCAIRRTGARACRNVQMGNLRRAITCVFSADEPLIVDE